MIYRVVVTDDAQVDLDNILAYLIFDKKSPSAASAVLDDFNETKHLLSDLAGSFRDCENPELRRRGYKRALFQRHRYFMMYRVVDELVFIDRIFHELQDYEKKDAMRKNS